MTLLESRSILLAFSNDEDTAPFIFLAEKHLPARHMNRVLHLTDDYWSPQREKQAYLFAGALPGERFAGRGSGSLALIAAVALKPPSVRCHAAEALGLTSEQHVVRLWRSLQGAAGVDTIG